uniref:Uncharacterized protein n=1 Tax=Ciona savignyi TaxID=51511 RepID=H2YTD9_CIOSA
MKLKIKIECPNKSDSFFVVKHSITWRSEKAEVSTKLLKNIPSVLHTTFLKNAGISAAICKSICKLYLSVEASNFRDDGGVVSCDVTNDISFRDDVKKGVVAKNIQGELQCLHKKLDDDHFLVLSNVQLHCCTEGFVQNSDNDYRKRNKNMTSEYEQMEKTQKTPTRQFLNPLHQTLTK